jgi:hypothetical protein
VPGPTGLGTAYAFDAIPIGVKIYIGADVTATIGGTLACKCADKPNCKVETDVNINLTVPISFPVTQTAVGIAARFVPWVGWAYTAASRRPQGVAASGDAAQVRSTSPICRWARRSRR